MLPDYDKYLPMFKNEDITLEEKKDYIDRISNFMNDKAFDDPERFEELAKIAEDKK